MKQLISMEKIALRGVEFRYGVGGQSPNVLNALNFSIKKGEFVSIIGPSGCGKSTLLRLLAGLNVPSSGRILIDGKQLDGPGSDRAVVFQHYSLFPWMSARNNILFGAAQANRDKSRREIGAITDHWLDVVGLREFAHKYPSQLSGGMQQRVAITRAFAMDASILLMDEPFSAVDTRNRVALQELLLKLWGEDGTEKKTVVFITHDIDEAILLSDRIMVMSARTGSVREKFAVEFERPRNRGTVMKSANYAGLRNRLVDLFHDDEAELLADATLQQETAVNS